MRHIGRLVSAVCAMAAVAGAVDGQTVRAQLFGRVLNQGTKTLVVR